VFAIPRNGAGRGGR